MAKKFFKRFIPDNHKIRDHKYLKIFGRLLHDPNLWHLNRYSVSMAFSVGLFFAFVPVPFQMVLAGAVAIMLRSNLPISVALVWITNPLTMPPIFYFAFKVGAYVLGREPRGFHFELSFDWLFSGLQSIATPFLLGCFICGVTAALTSNFLVRVIWRYVVTKNWRERIAQRKAKLAEKLKKQDK